jgi:hypothetical protein
MGYTTRNNGLITDYWPDEADNSFYIAVSPQPSLQDILENGRMLICWTLQLPHKTCILNVLRMIGMTLQIILILFVLNF